MNETKHLIYTVGHSNHSADYFLELLKTYSVNCLVDVRSLAGSRFNPQFNKSALSAQMNSNGIQYLHFAKEFGARRSEPHLLDKNGQLDFEKVRQTKDFISGVGKLKEKAAGGFSVALMCAEADPLRCHRFSMLSVALKTDFEIYHIIKDKTLLSNTELENRMLKLYEKKIPGPSVFLPHVTHQEQLAVAYRLHNKDVAYSPLRSTSPE